MTLEEKFAQLGSVWLGFDEPEEIVAPGQDTFAPPRTAASMRQNSRA
jgi:hypothetical protein